MEKDTMTMEDKYIYQIDSYLNDAEVEFDRILAMDGRKNKIVHRSALIAFASAAAVALFFWLGSAMPSSVEQRLTPVQIAEGISQMMLLDIGDIESIEAVPKDTYAILTARMKDGSTCSYIMKCDEVEGTTTLFAHNNN